MAKAHKNAPKTEPTAPEEKVSAPKSRGLKGVPDTATMTVNVANPKRGGSKASAVFALYATGLSLADLFAKAATTEGIDQAYITPCLAWDAKHGFITVEGYTPPGGVTVPKPKAPPKPKAEKKVKAAKVAKTEEQLAMEAQADAEATAETME